MRKFLSAAAFAAVGVVTMGNAHAQTDAAPSPAGDAPAASNEAEVIVTATKRETKLQETPIAISVLSQDKMTDNHALSLLALSDGIVPSLRVSTFEARQSALTVGIRGIAPFDQNQTARDSGVGTYIDGVYLGRTQGLNAALFDVQRIEVLRGPQGTLFGRNTEGGALSVVTKAPTGKFEGRVVAGVGNYGAYNGEIHQNFEEFHDLSIKVDGVIQHQDPTTKNPMNGQAGWNQYHRVGGRIAGLWKPVDGFSAELAVDYADDQNTPFFSQLVNFNPLGKTVRPVASIPAVSPAGSAAAGGAPVGFINALPPLIKVHPERQSVSDIGTIQQVSEDETGGATLTVKYEVAPHLELRSITAARGVSTNQWDNSGIASRNVFAPGALFGRYSLSDLYQRQFSQEFQAVGSAYGNVDYVFGLYYFTEHAKESAATPFTNIWNADGTGYQIFSFNPNAAISGSNSGWDYGQRRITRRTRADSDSLAAYGQATWTPTDPLHITVGGRWTKDTRSGNMDRTNNNTVNYNLDYSESRFDPLLIVAYDLDKDTHVYAKYSTGFRAGGANARSADFSSKFAAEEVTSYEAGIKSTLLDGRAVLNAAFYHMDRDNTQIDFDQVLTANGPSGSAGTHFEETRNAPGTSTIDGVELDATFRLDDNWTVGGSYAYTKIKIPAAPFPFTVASNGIAPGQPFPVLPIWTPPNAGSVFVDYSAPVGSLNFRAHTDASYADGQYSFPTEFTSNVAGQTIVVAKKGDASFIVNGTLALENITLKDGDGPTATISLWARNLLDEEHIYRISAANEGTIGDYANFNPPRTFGVEFRVNY